VRQVAVGEGAVGVIAPADRSRVWAAGTGDGAVVVRSATSGKLVARLEVGSEGRSEGGESVGAVESVAIDGGGERVTAGFAGGGSASWRIEPGHPDVSVRGLFGPVQYEGREAPTLVYQSTGGDGAEPKYSLVPLVWGTVKATVVAMAIAVPLAVLAAVYTSEFLSPGSRRRVKPAIELMASLPSVVLGFIAAAVVAPFVRDHLAACMLGMATVPGAVVVCAGAWQVVPEGWRRRVRGSRLAVVIGMSCVAGAMLAVVMAGLAEGWLFGEAGFRSWLDTAEGARGVGSAWGGWVCVLMPVSAAVVWVVNARVVSGWWNGWIDGLGGGVGGGRGALLECVRVAGLVAGAVGLACVGAWGLTSAGWDARDSLMGTFSQRNTLVVGVVMGVAVIPIIYTIAEDALQAVPSGLRSASLGCGATAWQTAVRVVLPVAGSGIFSACMVGLGRAVGETMIVLMATGNTPEIDLSVFSGFRSLAANIAVELPEAPRGGTHYRVLFLCGLVLFVLTLVINTTAEVVRQRFRKRSSAL
jgi:phosphate transport system permease protein